MATLQKVITVEIAPDKFVDCCSEMELRELRLLVEARLERIDGVRKDDLSPCLSTREGKGLSPALSTREGKCSTAAERAAEPAPAPATESGQESKKRAWTEEEVRQLQDMADSGMKVKDIAVALGKTTGTVSGKLYQCRHAASSGKKSGNPPVMKDRFLNNAY
jgi:hypothetical protein